MAPELYPVHLATQKEKGLPFGSLAGHDPRALELLKYLITIKSAIFAFQRVVAEIWQGYDVEKFETNAGHIQQDGGG